MKRFYIFLMLLALLSVSSLCYAAELTGGMEPMTEMAAVVGFIIMLVPVIVGILKSKTELVTSENAGIVSTVVGVILCLIANALGMFMPEMTMIQAIAFGAGGGLAGTGGYSVMSKVNAKPARPGRGS